MQRWHVFGGWTNCVHHLPRGILQPDDPIHDLHYLCRWIVLELCRLEHVQLLWRQLRPEPCGTNELPRLPHRLQSRYSLLNNHMRCLLHLLGPVSLLVHWNSDNEVFFGTSQFRDVLSPPQLLSRCPSAEETSVPLAFDRVETNMCNVPSRNLYIVVPTSVPVAVGGGGGGASAQHESIREVLPCATRFSYPTEAIHPAVFAIKIQIHPFFPCSPSRTFQNETHAP